MLPITLRAQSFDCGPIEVPYASVAGAGIGLSKGQLGVRRTLFVSYRLPTDANPRLITFGLRNDPEGARFADDLRARVSDRWKGEAGFFAMRKRLGFSNKTTFFAVAAITLIVTACVVGWAISLQH
jgi:hypothetical protein